MGNEQMASLSNYFIGGTIGASLLVAAYIIIKFLKDLPAIQAGLKTLLIFFRWLGASTERAIIKNDIESKVNTFVARIGKDVINKNLIKYRIKLKWVVASEANKALIKNGDVVVRLNYDLDNRANLINSLSVYLDESLAPNFKFIADDDYWCSSKYVIMQEFSLNSGPAYFGYFSQNYLRPFMSASPTLKDVYDKMVKLNDNGVFYPVLLNEYESLGTLYFGRFVPPFVKRELENFLAFLFDIETVDEYLAAHGSKPPLDFNSQFIKVGVVLVASPEQESFEPHKQRVLICFKRGATRVYLTGWAERNIDGLRSITADLTATGDYAVIGKPCFFELKNDGHGGEGRRPKRNRGVCYAIKKLPAKVNRPH